MSYGPPRPTPRPPVPPPAPISAAARRAAWDQRWSEASVLRAHGRVDLAFPQFWALTCDALTLEDETLALTAAHACYERLKGPYIPKELQ